MRQKFLSCVILLMFTGLFLTTAGCSSTSSASAHATPAEQKTIVVGIDGDYQPFGYVDSTGTPAGFDVDSMTIS